MHLNVFQYNNIHPNRKKCMFFGLQVVNPKNDSGSVTSSVILASDRSPPHVFPSVVLLPVSMLVASPHCLYMKEQVTFVEAAPLINITVPTVVHSI